MKFEVPHFIKKALKILNEYGYEGYLVGGCVRDILMGRKPYDFDLTTNATPEKIKEIFADYHVIATGLKHGTVTVIIEGESIEITTYRIDGEYEDNRHPKSVYFTSDIKDDLARRDFTINAMAYNEEAGLVDLFGGRQHIENKIISCVGDADRRFCEDGLRILRALRFAAVLGFDIEKKTALSILKNKELLKNIAVERIYSEFTKLICGSSAKEILLDFYEVFCVFIPEILPMVNFNQNNKHHCYDVYVHTLTVLDSIKPDKNLRLAALFHDIGKPHCYTEDKKGTGHFYGHSKISSEITRKILKRLKVDNDTLNTVQNLVLDHDRSMGESEQSLKRFLSGCSKDHALELMKLKKADVMGKDPKYLGRIEIIENYEKAIEKIYAENECLSLKSLNINGKDIQKIGAKGAAIGKILKMLLSDVIDGKIENKKPHLMSEARKIYSDLRENRRIKAD